LLQIIFFVKKVTKNKSFESKKEFTKIINWISWNTLQKIISTEIFYYKKWYTENNIPLPNQKKIDEKVLEFITYYTNTIWFSWVKYLRVFYNILFIVFEEKWLNIEKEEYEKTIDSFLFTLETWIDSQLGKYLYSLWLPRSICIKVNKTIAIFTKNIEEYNKENIDNLFISKRVKAFLKIRLSKIAYTELYRNLDL
jgi:tetratricopeptide (TPR) repeat protein